MNTSLAQGIREAGSVIDLLRNYPAHAHTFPVRPEFTNWRTEQSSWATTCALLDQSHHMTNLFVEGPDALQLFSDFGVNSFANFGPGKAKQYVAVGPTGHIIGDAVLFHLEQDYFNLVGHPMMLDWVQFQLERGSYNATATRDENSAVRTDGPPVQYRYELQGPTAEAVLAAATGAAVPDTKFFQMSEFTIAGKRVRGLRHGMAGRPGFELFGPWEEGPAVYNALLTAGEAHGLVRCGSKAYSTANLESGWAPAPMAAIYHDDPILNEYREWLPLEATGSIAGSFTSDDIRDHYLTLDDLDYSRIVRFDHDFFGAEALKALMAEPKRKKVTLVWDPADVAAAMGSIVGTEIGAKYFELPKLRYGTHHEDLVLQNGVPVGVSLDCGYVANERAMVSIAAVDLAHAEPGTRVQLLWGEDPNSTKPTVERHRQVTINATVAPIPFAAFARQMYRSA